MENLPFNYQFSIQKFLSSIQAAVYNCKLKKKNIVGVEMTSRNVEVIKYI